MRNKISGFYNFFVLFLGLVVISCENKDSKKESKEFVTFEKYFAKNIFFQDNIHRRNIIFFIPIDGCDDCVNKSISFMKKYPNNFSYVLIAATKPHLRLFEKKFSISKIQNLNAFYDCKDAIRDGIYSGFPYIIQLNERNEIVQKITLNALNIESELLKIEMTF
jgi:hypothetical protein